MHGHVDKQTNKQNKKNAATFRFRYCECQWRLQLPIVYIYIYMKLYINAKSLRDFLCDRPNLVLF